ncbi:tetratricopeptide repeat protein 1-like [Littorina saxatilis]|uniref:Tetratricopeptide repeat protein 1 n=1 Tax=Littorina saxatilis TaxID=31220 RepID=A0AAN9BPN9_9CAEN
MEKDTETKPGSLKPESRLDADSKDTETKDSEKTSLNPQSDIRLASPPDNNQSKEHPVGQGGDFSRKDKGQGDKTNTESLVDRLISMAVEGEYGSEEEEEGDFLSASEGDSSDEEKIQEWGDTLSEPVDTLHSSTQFNTAAAADKKCNTVGDGVSEVKDSDEEDAAAAETAAGDVEEGEGGGDTEEKDADEKEEDAKKKEEEERERKRQETEDALTEEERQSRLAEAVKVKTTGNEVFKQSQFTEAVELYSQGLELCPLKYVQQRSIMLSNRAACYMKEEKYDEAVKDCSKAIDLQPTYIKAINRRADAFEKLEKLEEALKDHQKILELDRTQANSYHTCMRLESEIKERNEKMKDEMIGKLKDLGNLVLRPFGLSTNNFQLNQDPNSGGYSVQFVQSPPSNGH